MESNQTTGKVQIFSKIIKNQSLYRKISRKHRTYKRIGRRKE
jgi:hypothetical protein